jgi:hypothetical protein
MGMGNWELGIEKNILLPSVFFGSKNLPPQKPLTSDL